MPRITLDQTSLVGGVSQQQEYFRAKNTVRAMTNCYASWTVGCEKRHPWKHVRRVVPTGISGANPIFPGDLKVHPIDRGAGAQYILVLGWGKPYVYDRFTGARYTVSFQSGTTDYSYLKAYEPQKFALHSAEGLDDASNSNLPPDLAVTTPTATSWRVWHCDTTPAAATYAYTTPTTIDPGPLVGVTYFNTLYLEKTLAADTDSAFFYYEFNQADEPTAYNFFADSNVWQRYSIYVKQANADGASNFDLGFYNATDGTAAYGSGFWAARARFTWSDVVGGATLASTGLIAGESYNTESGVEDVGNGWYRAWISHKTTLAEVGDERRPGLFYDGTTASVVKWTMHVVGACLEEGDSPVIGDFFMRPEKAYKATTIEDYTFITNTTKLTAMAATTSTTRAAYLGAWKKWTITVTANPAAGARIDIAGVGATKTLTCITTADSTVDNDPPNYEYSNNVAIETPTRIAEALSRATGAVVGVSPASGFTATLTFYLPSAYTVTEGVDSANITVANPSTGSFADELYLDVKTANYAGSYWTGLGMGNYQGRVAAALTATAGTSAGGAVCVNGFGATLGKCFGSNDNKGVWVAPRVDQIGTADAAAGLQEALRTMFLAVPNAKASTYYVLNTAASTTPWATAQALYADRSSGTIRLMSDGTFTETNAMDSFAGDGLVPIHGEVKRFTDLPEMAQDGCRIRVKGSNESELDDYFVVFEAETTGGFGVGTWVESVDHGVKLRFDKATMPHQLVRKLDSTGAIYFEYGPALDVNPLSPGYGSTWVDRLVGDDTLNPQPSFIGKAITDLKTGHGRLWFTTNGQSFVGSEVNRYFNFWRTTVIRYKDGDPTDNQVAGAEGYPFRHIEIFGSGIMILSRKAQILLPIRREGLTNKNAEAKVVLREESSEFVPPVFMGRSVWMAYPRGNFSGIKEIRPSEEGEFAAKDEATAQAPAFIEGTVLGMAGSAHAQCLVVWASGDRAKFWVMKLDESGGQRNQQAWWDGTVGGADCQIQGMCFIEDKLYAIVRRSYGSHLEVMTIQDKATDPDSNWLCYLDRKVDDNTNGFSKTYTTFTRLTLPYRKDTGAILFVVDAETGAVYPVQTESTTTSDSKTVTRLDMYTGDGSLLLRPLYVGQLYTAQVTLQNPYVRERSGAGDSVNASGRVQASHAYICFENTNNLEMQVTVRGGTPRAELLLESSKYFDRITSTAPFFGIGKVPLSLAGKSEELEIILGNQGHLGFGIQKVEFTADYQPVGVRA